MFVGDTGIGVLLLDETGDAHAGCRIQRSRTGIAAHSHRHLGLEVGNNLPHHALAFQIVDGHTDIPGRPERTDETTDGQSLDLVAGSRHTLHLHSSEGSYKKYFCLRLDGPDSIGDGYGGEDMPSRSTSADDDSHFVVHNATFLILGLHLMYEWQNYKNYLCFTSFIIVFFSNRLFSCFRAVCGPMPPAAQRPAPFHPPPSSSWPNGSRSG